MPKRKDIKKIMVIGSGPIVIGHRRVWRSKRRATRSYW